jgi:hypothetical protein
MCELWGLCGEASEPEGSKLNYVQRNAGEFFWDKGIGFSSDT